MPNEAVSEHVLKYRTDEASVARSIQAVENIKDTFVDAGKVIADTARPIRDVGKAADDLRRGEKSVDAMAAAYEHLRERAEDLKKQLDGIKKKLEENKQAFAEAANAPETYAESIKRAAQETQLYGDVGSRVRDIGGAVSRVGGSGAQQTFGIGTDLLDAAEGFGRIKAELPALVSQLGLSATGFGVLAAGVGIVSVAAWAYTQAIKEEKKAREEARLAAQQYVDMLEDVASVIARGTSQDVENAIAATEAAIKEKEIAKAALDERIAIAEAARREEISGGRRARHTVVTFEETPEFAALQDQFGEITTATLEVWRDASADLGKDTTALQGKTEELRDALADGVTAGADMLLAEQHLADERNRQSSMVIAREEQNTRELLQAQDRSRTWNSEQVAARQEQIAFERQAAELEEDKLAKQLLAGQIEQDAYFDRITALHNYKEALDREAAALTDVVLPAIRTREGKLQDEAAALNFLEKITGAATDGVKVLTGGVDDLAEGFDDGAERLKKFTDEQAEVDAKRDIEVQRNQVDALRKRVQDLADHYVEMADLDADYYGERQDVLDGLGEDLDENQQESLDQVKEYNQESLRLAEDHQDEVLRIQRDTNRDYNEAARARDTAGALAALRAGEQQLDDAQATYEKEQERRDEDQRDLLTDLKAERQTKIDAAQKELRDLEQKHIRERSAKETAFQTQIRREDEQRRIAATRQAQDWQREDQARQAHYGVVETRAANHNTTMQNIAQGGYAIIQRGWSMFMTGLAAAVPAAHTGGTTMMPSPIRLPNIGFASGGVPPLHTPVKLGERGVPEIAEFANGYRVKVAGRGPETGMFMDPVQIYTREQAQRAGTTINVSLGGLGGVQIQAAAGRSLVDQIAPQITALVVDALEDLVAQYDPEVAA